MGFFVSAICQYGARALGPFLDKFLYQLPADTIVMLTPFKFSFICIGGPPIRMALSNDSTGCTVVSAGRRYQRTLVMKFGLPDVSAARRHTWNSMKSVCALTFLSADGLALSADPIFLCPFRPLLSADRSLVLAASLSASFHTSTQTLSPLQAQRRSAATQSSCLIFQSLSAPKE